MPQATYGVSLAVGGVSIQKPVVREGDHPNSYEVKLPAGKSGTLSTRTSDTAGTVTAASHGLAQNDVVDVHWGTSSVRYGMTVGIVAGDDVPVSGGAGDVLPAANTAVVITKQVSINTQIDGDAIQIIGFISEGAKAHVDMQDSGNATIEEIDLAADAAIIHDIAGGATNVFTGNPIAKTKASNGSSSVEATLKIVSLEDSTP